MRQAEPVEWPGIHRHQGQQQARRALALGELREARQGLIYTRAGVLDMTRRRATQQPQVEQIVGYIEGGAS